MITLRIVRTTAENRDFKQLIAELDADLRIRDGEDHAFFAQFNKTDNIRHVIVAYTNMTPVGCGAFKYYSADTAEIKRMYVVPEYRGNGAATSILMALEQWVHELNLSFCILETGIKQPEAIGLYQKNGYVSIPNYGPYEHVATSVCMKKQIG